MKKHLGHGAFLQWLDEEFQWSVKTAENMMRVAARFKFENFTNLPIDQSALYLLAERSTPNPFIEDVIQRAREGIVMNYTKVKDLLRDYTIRQSSNFPMFNSTSFAQRSPWLFRRNLAISMRSWPWWRVASGTPVF